MARSGSGPFCYVLTFSKKSIPDKQIFSNLTTFLPELERATLAANYGARIEKANESLLNTFLETL